MHVSASMCFPRDSQSSCVIMCCISGPHVKTRFGKTKVIPYILADLTLFKAKFSGLLLRK